MVTSRVERVDPSEGEVMVMVGGWLVVWQEQVDELKVVPEGQSVSEDTSPGSSPQQWLVYQVPPAQEQAEDKESGSITDPRV